MSFATDAVKEVAIRGMKVRFDGQLGEAYGFLMFGGFGVPGLVDGAVLASRGSAEAATELTEDLANLPVGAPHVIGSNRRAAPATARGTGRAAYANGRSHRHHAWRKLDRDCHLLYNSQRSGG